MRAKYYLILLLAVAPICSARQVKDTDRYLPFVQNGGGWSTKVTLINLSATQASFELAFRPPTGFFGNWDLTLKGNAMAMQNATASGIIPPGGMVMVETDGAGDAPVTGYAVLSRYGDAVIGIDATLRNSTTGASFSLPLSPAREDQVALAFDNADGNVTQFAWLSETDFAHVDYTAYDLDGHQLSSGSFEFLTLDTKTQQVFNVTDWFAELKDRRGVMLLNVSYPTVGFYDQSTFAAATIQTSAAGLTSASTSLSTGAWAPRKY